MESLRPVVFRFGDAEFEQLEGRLRVAGHDRRLRPQTAAVLAQLLEHAGQLVTHDKLIEAVWGDTVVTDNSLAQCISEIRSALGAGQESLIDTVPRRGYVVRAGEGSVRDSLSLLDQAISQLKVDAADILLLNGQSQTLEFAVGRDRCA